METHPLLMWGPRENFLGHPAESSFKLRSGQGCWHFALDFWTGAHGGRPHYPIFPGPGALSAMGQVGRGY